MQKRAIIINKNQADKLEKLRRASYHHSQSFKVTSEAGLDEYCKWGPDDKSGIVLGIMAENDELTSSLRGNIYSDPMTHESHNEDFEGVAKTFVKYPVLDMTFAATSPDNFGHGFLAVLRYYMYFLHRHAVKSITGRVITGSPMFLMLDHLGYHFKQVNKSREFLENNDSMNVAVLYADEIDKAIQKLRAKYDELIKEYPLIIG